MDEVGLDLPLVHIYNKYFILTNCESILCSVAPALCTPLFLLLMEYIVVYTQRRSTKRNENECWKCLCDKRECFKIRHKAWYRLTNLPEIYEIRITWVHKNVITYECFINVHMYIHKLIEFLCAQKRIVAQAEYTASKQAEN